MERESFSGEFERRIAPDITFLSRETYMNKGANPDEKSLEKAKSSGSSFITTDINMERGSGYSHAISSSHDSERLRNISQSRVCSRDLLPIPAGTNSLAETESTKVRVSSLRPSMGGHSIRRNRRRHRRREAVRNAIFHLNKLSQGVVGAERCVYTTLIKLSEGQRLAAHLLEQSGERTRPA